MSFFNQNVSSDKICSQKSDNCNLCKLHETCTSPKMRLYGDGAKRVLIVGSYPYKEEDRIGIYGRDKEMYFLIDQLESIGVEFERDCWYTTAVNCRPAKGEPTTKNVNYCKPRLLSLIEKLDPIAIILLGETAFDSLVEPRLTGRLEKVKANDFAGEVIPDTILGRWVCPIWAVSYLLSTKSYEDGVQSKPLYQRDSAVLLTWKNSLRRAFSLENKPESFDYTSLCKITQNVDQAIEWVTEALGWKNVAWDVEASGKKLHKKGHYIYCISISNGQVSYAFPNFDDPLFKRAWKKFMLSNVGKIAHNLQYENESQKIFNDYWVNNWIWDTMLSQHIKHNKRPTGLKYCVYVMFGIIGYDDKADKFIRSSEKDNAIYGSNAFNTIKDAPLDDILLYNALDSLFTYKIYEQHKRELTDKQIDCVKLYTETAVTLSKMTNNGFYVKKDNFAAVEDVLQKSIDDKFTSIMNSPEIKQWDGAEPINFNSTVQLGHLLFDILKCTPSAYTTTKRPALNEEALEKMEIPVVKEILDYRKLVKMKSTYIDGWKRECVDDVVHSQFMLNTVDTGRSSSGNPNSQNSYKRDKEKKKIVRSLITPRPGHRLVEYDFHGLETYTNMFYSGDPQYKKYLLEEGSDMHMEVACKVFLMTPDQVLKEYRTEAKSSGTFAWTYGSYYVLVARDLWEYICKTPALKAHLASKGVKDYTAYERVVKKAEEYFWTEMFSVHDSWRKEQWDLYRKQGYLESYTGFRYQCPMDRKNCMNSAPQGTGAQCLFWTINHALKDVEERGLDALLIGEIHDSAIWDLSPEVEDKVDHLMWLYATQLIQKEWPWISVGLVMEKERSAINGSWAEMEDCGALRG